MTSQNDTTGASGGGSAGGIDPTKRYAVVYEAASSAYVRAQESLLGYSRLYLTFVGALIAGITLLGPTLNQDEFWVLSVLAGLGVVITVTWWWSYVLGMREVTAFEHRLAALEEDLEPKFWSIVTSTKAKADAEAEISLSLSAAIKWAPALVAIALAFLAAALTFVGIAILAW